jgi:hypothetical protein
MSYKTKFFEWDVSLDPSQIGVPVGYEFEFRRQFSQFDHVLYRLSTFRENAVEGAFFYSFDGETFLPFPLGEQGKEFYNDYTMRVKISSAMSENIFALSNGSIFRLAGDGSHIIESFDTALDLSYFSIDQSKDELYAYYENTLFVFYSNNRIRLKRSYNLGSSANEIIVDGSRGVFWQIRDNDVLLRSLVDSSVLKEISLGSTIIGSVEKYLYKTNGNIIISAETSSGFEIFEIDFYLGTVLSATSSNLILDVDKGEGQSFFVTFGNQYIGSFESGILDETFIDTGRVEVTHVSGKNEIFYLVDKDVSQVVKFEYPYFENWAENGKIYESSDLRVRENDESVIYAGDGNVICYRDDAVDLGSSLISNSDISVELSGQSKPSHTIFSYRAIYGEIDLGQSSSSSSSSTSSSSQSRSESTSSEGYSRSSLSESEQSRSTESSSSTSTSSSSSDSTSSSSSLGFSSSSESSSTSEGFSESSSTSEGFSESSSTSIGFSESSSSTTSEGFSESSSTSIGFSESSSTSEGFSESSSTSEGFSESSSTSKGFSESSSSTSEGFSESSSTSEGFSESSSTSEGFSESSSSTSEGFSESSSSTSEGFSESSSSTSEGFSESSSTSEGFSESSSSTSEGFSESSSSTSLGYSESSSSTTSEEFSESSSSTTSEGFSESSSSTTSEGFSESSSESTYPEIIEECNSPCDLTVRFKTYSIPDRLEVYDNNGLVLDTGSISTGSSFVQYDLTQLECPVRVCIYAPTSGTAWAVQLQGCGFNISTTGGQVVEKCFETPGLQSESSSSSESELAPVACGTTGCTKDGVAVTCPDIILRVTSSDWASVPGGTITWCGKTWSENGTGTDASNGEEVRVCPSSYVLNKASTVTSLSTVKQGTQRWSGPGNDLYMNRRYYKKSLSFLGCLSYKNFQSLAIRPDANSSVDAVRWLAPTCPAPKNIARSDLGLITTFAEPTYSDYRFANSASNTTVNPWWSASGYTIGNETYHWRRGDNWSAP